VFPAQEQTPTQVQVVWLSQEQTPTQVQVVWLSQEQVCGPVTQLHMHNVPTGM
jgi:hypothetical protein